MRNHSSKRSELLAELRCLEMCWAACSRRGELEARKRYGNRIRKLKLTLAAVDRSLRNRCGI